MRMRPGVPLFVLLLAGCAEVVAPAGESVGPGYVTGGGEWNTGGGITVVAALREHGGRVAVCGAWTTDRQSALSATLNEAVMEAGSVFAGGRRLIQNLAFMPRYPETPSLAGRAARCAVTDAPWDPVLARARPVLRFPRMVFPEDGGDEAPTAGTGDAVVFRQTERPDASR